MVPVLDGSVEGAQVKSRNDPVTFGEVIDVVTDLDNVARQIGAGDHIVLDRERVLPGGDGKVAEVESDASDMDQDLVG